MKKLLTKKSILLMVSILVIASIFASCGTKQKEIVLSNNVKQDVKNQEKDLAKAMELYHLKSDGHEYSPIGWKDNDNIIAVKADADKTKYQNNYKASKVISLCSINIKTSKVTDIRKMKNAVGVSIYNNIELYFENGKLAIYNMVDNSFKEVFDLSDIIKEIKVNTHDSSVNQRNILKYLNVGLVKGSDRYVYIMDYWNKEGVNNMVLRMLDIKSGKITKSHILSNKLISKDQAEYTWSYSKATNAFYVFSFIDGALLKYKLDKPDNIELLICPNCGNIIDVSNDGKELYIQGYNISTSSEIIEIYNILNEKVNELASVKRTTSVKNRIGYYTQIFFNNKKDYIFYGIGNALYYKDQCSDVKFSSYIAEFNGKSLSNIQKLPLRTSHKGYNFSYTIFNQKGDKFIYVVKCLSFAKGGAVDRCYGYDNYIYQMKKR